MLHVRDEIALAGVATEQNGIRKVHGDNVDRHVCERVRHDAVRPVVWDALGNVVVTAGAILRRAKESGDGGVVGNEAAVLRRKEFVEESGGAVEE